MKTFYTTLIISTLLIVCGFVVPPLGIIDGSVLTAVGMLLVYAALAQVPDILEAVRDGQRIKLRKGDFEATLEQQVTNDTNPADT